MSSATFSNLIKGVFIFAYATFLTASISHVAYFFHCFEPIAHNENWWQEWGGPYGLAGSIDVTGLMLTIGVTYMRNGVSGFALTVVWVFIFLLTGFSWIANWEYAQQFQSQGLSQAAGQQILFFKFTFGQLNPVLASSFSFLNLAYSVIAEFFNAKPRTAREILDESENLKAIAGAVREKKNVQAELQAANNEGTKRWIKGKLAIIQDVLPGRKPFGNQQSPRPEGQAMLAQNGAMRERTGQHIQTVSTDESVLQIGGQDKSVNEGKLVEQSTQSVISDDGKTVEKTDEIHALNDILTEPDSSVLIVLNRYPKIKVWLSTGQRTATIEEIAAATQQSKRKVVNRANDGTLKRSPRNAQLILVSTVIEWLKTASLPPQRSVTTQEQAMLEPLEKVS